MEVQDIEVDVAVVSHGHRVTLGVVGEPHDQGIVLHVGQKTFSVVIIIGVGSVGSAGSQSIRVIRHVPGGGAVGHGLELAATFPGVCPGAIVQGIANGVVGVRGDWRPIPSKIRY